MESQRYDHKTREKHWQHIWETKGIYHWKNDRSREDTYVIDTPPPTVSGLLHMGHIFSYTHADFIARYQRMKGKDVFYPMGFDDNGLPTERLVEKVKKIRAKDVSRETFIEHCNEISAEARKEFRALFTANALSVDWNLEYHTISEHARRISQASFIDLYNKGEVYRQLQPMLWDPVDQTAIAQAEVEDKELPGVFCDIRFAVADSDESFVIGTTRPELLPACVAIFYHPDDVRYQHLAGKKAITPLFGVEVPILSDDTVEPDKGTGIMMCCTFGDEADIAKWKKHKLETRVILNQYGKLEVEGELQGLKATAARDKMIEMLEASGALEAKKPITHAVKCAERSGAPLEILPTHQWFVKVLEHKEALKEQSKRCNWKPEWMQKRMEQWIDGLNWDWCISRQRYYGVPFPVWYSKREGEEGKILIPDADQLPVNPIVDLPKGYNREEVEPDTDVMDTWATSAISPQISAWNDYDVMPAQAGIQQSVVMDSRLRGNDGFFPVPATNSQKLFPADLRPQAHEIIRTWAFYTLVKSHLHHQTIPWHNLMISGWCLASDKTKMSKSKGNVITPTALIEEKGTDAVRYWASTAKLGTDTAFSEDLLKIGNKLVTKLWNASKFVSLQLAALKHSSTSAAQAIASGTITEALDKWMVSKVHQAILEADKCFAAYDYAGARAAAEDVFWNDFCDNYLELVKARAYGNMGEAGQQSALHTLWHCLNALLKLFAPFVPHITEEIFSLMYAEEYQQRGSIHARGSFPDASAYRKDEEAEAIGQASVALLELIRKAKSEKGVSIKYPIDTAYVMYARPEHLLPALEDVKAAGNITEMSTANVPPAGSEFICLRDDALNLAVSLAFAVQADVA